MLKPQNLLRPPSTPNLLLLLYSRTGPRRALSLRLSDTRVYEPKSQTFAGFFHFQPSLDALSLPSDVIRSIEILSLQNIDTWSRAKNLVMSCRGFGLVARGGVRWRVNHFGVSSMLASDECVTLNPAYKPSHETEKRNQAKEAAMLKSG